MYISLALDLEGEHHAGSTDTVQRNFCQATPVIPAIREIRTRPDQAIAAHGKIVYLLTGDRWKYCESMIQKILCCG